MSEMVSMSLVIAGAVVFVVLILIAFPVWLYHRRELVKLNTGNPTAEKVIRRLDAIEARCKAIEERLNKS